MSCQVKICGLRTPETLEAALEAGADFVGLVFFAPSPRNVDLSNARALADAARGRAAIVALTVDADDETLTEIVTQVRPDVLQLHGQETPARVAEIAARFQRPLWKAVAVSSAEDLAHAALYVPYVERILFDAKPPKGATRPGGNALSFDWTLLAGLDLAKPFVLSGGLTAENVAEAIRITGASSVDVSSGVERQPGEKDIEMIRTFVQRARA